MTKLSNIRELGRYQTTETGNEHNIKKGRNMQRGTDLIFYLYMCKRQFISDMDFYSIYEKVQ
jgi:zona occludens toxin (predicted ATPase)